MIATLPLYGPILKWGVSVIFIAKTLCWTSRARVMSFIRGQPPAQHTKVVDNGLCPLKTGSTHLCVPVCVNDTVLSKPAGRNAVDGQAQTNNVSCVCTCGSIRCKTCKHMSQGSTFMSNVTRKSYSVVSHSCSMNCATENVIYLISCKKCGIQYIGETSQKLRNKMNNHRNRLRNLTNLYLYQHFNISTLMDTQKKTFLLCP